MIKRTIFVILLLGTLLLAGCTRGTQVPAASATPPAPSATSTPTPLPPTPTPTPLPPALRVNGTEISLADYQAELERLQAAAAELNLTLTPDEQKQRVLDELIQQALLANYATAQGLSVSDEDVQARLDALAANMGGAEALAAWQTRYGYSADSFRAALQRSLLADAGRDAIINAVPQNAEQIHARQILLLDETTANNVLLQLKSGADFATLAYVYDPLAGGDLSWFPRGYLTQPDVEAAAFALQPGETSGIIKTSFGYHILLVVEREADRPLSPDTRRALQHTALQSWLETTRASATIEIMLP